jgi:hypothetical protein
VMPSMEATQVVLALGLGPGQRDLGNLPHLRGPSTQGFHELAEGETTGWLGPEPVLMDVLHGPVY